MSPMPYAPTVPELAAANREASRRTRPRRSLRRVVVADARRRRLC